MVETDGPDGKLADFPIKYVFGVTPLQQYLVEFPGGRLQALSAAWDTEKKQWFFVYPGRQDIPPGDWLHWTRQAQNWNTMCADCHSTDVRKRYDAAADSFATTWSEINVACEACHGPASRHVTQARATKPDAPHAWDAPGWRATGLDWAGELDRQVAVEFELGPAARARRPGLRKIVADVDRDRDRGDRDRGGYRSEWHADDDDRYRRTAPAAAHHAVTQQARHQRAQPHTDHLATRQHGLQFNVTHGQPVQEGCGRQPVHQGVFEPLQHLAQAQRHRGWEQ